MVCSSFSTIETCAVTKSIFSGILSNSATDRDYWWDWKVQCFHDCHRAVDRITTCDNTGPCAGRAERLTLLWIALAGGPQQQLTDPEPKRFMSILRYVLTLCDSNEEAEAFYLSRSLCDRLVVSEEAMADYVSFYLKVLAQQKDLYK